jgi:predicted DNA-binding transcriptional regulator AlpA
MTDADKPTLIRSSRPSVLPPGVPPRGLSRVQAAEYVGVSPTKFDELVADGRMPRPKRIDARRVWDRLALDESIAALTEEGSG